MARSVGEKPIVEFDHTTPEHAQNVEAINRDLRERCPVAFTESHGGYWLVAGYEDFWRAMRDEETFSSLHAPEPIDGIKYGGVNIPEAPYCNALHRAGPAGVDRVPAPSQPRVRAAAVEKLKGELLEFTTVCIDRVIETGEVDFVDDIANPIPAQAILCSSGCPLEDWDRYAAPAHEVVYTRPGTPEFRRPSTARRGCSRSCTARSPRGVQSPRDDVLTHMITTEVDGRLLTDDEVVSICGTIINGGVDTTTALLANAVDYLDRDRETRQRLDRRSRPDARGDRGVPPVLLAGTGVLADRRQGRRPRRRSTSSPATGCSCASGRSTATRSEFPTADEFVVDRFPNRHVAFGLGKHRCIGSTLARDRVPDHARRRSCRGCPTTRSTASASERYVSLGIVNGWISMPGRFTPGRRSAS